MKNPKPNTNINEFTFYKYGRYWKWRYTEWEEPRRKQSKREIIFFK